MTQVVIDDKYGSIFADMLNDGRLSASVTHAETARRASGHVVRVTVAVTDVADWDLRYRVLEQASQLENDFGISVICLFREDDA